MDLDLLSKLLRELVLEHNRVSLPGMGSFIAEKAPSVFSDRAMVIHPPFRRILFRPSEIWNDELLENKYAQEKGCKLEVAKHNIAEFIKLLKVDLNTNKTYRIPDFGTMRATEQNDYFFVANKDLFNYVETFGLEPVNIKFLPRKGEIESLNGKPVPNFFKTDIRSIINSASTFFEEDSVTQSEESFVLEDKPIVHAQELVTSQPTVHLGEPEPYLGEPEPHLGEPEPYMPPVVLAPPTAVGQAVVGKAEMLDKPTSSKFIKRVLITLLVIFSMILILVLLVVFKDELRPFWEWILYNKEERELIRMSVY